MNKPEIRLEGFADEWEQQTLIDILSPTVGNNTLSRAALNYENGEVKNIHYGDILVKFGSFVDAANDNIPFITNGSVGTYKSYLLKNGDIIFADTAEDETVGKVVEIVNSQDVNIVSGLHTMVFRPKDKFSAYFLGYYLNTNAYHHQLLPLMQGIKVLSLSRSNLYKTLLRYPTLLQEQTSIGNFFRSLDDSIVQKKQQCEQTANIKKAMLEKMFPKKGENVPEIRFDGFTGAWEKRKIVDICTISTGKSNTQDRTEDGIYPFYVRSSIVERSRRFLYDEEAVLTVGDGVGTGKVYHYINGKYDLHQRVYRMFDFNSGVKGKYFYYYFSNHFYERVMSMTAKTSVDSVRLEMISNMEIVFPNKKEQVMICTFFDNLDTLIEAQQQELEKLQNIKNALLNKMFV